MEGVLSNAIPGMEPLDDVLMQEIPTETSIDTASFTNDNFPVNDSTENELKLNSSSEVNDSDEEILNKSTTKKSKKAVVSSDEDNDSNQPSLSGSGRTSAAAIDSNDSDSSDDEPVLKSRIVQHSDSEDDENSIETALLKSSKYSLNSTTNKKSHQYRTGLIDSESSEDERNVSSKSPETHHCGTLEEEEQQKILDIAKNIHGKKSKSKPKKARESDVRDEHVRQAATIHSESQRMIREAPVVLPYHRPKQRTLQEFMNRRKQVIPLPVGRSALTMSMRNMNVLRQMEERRKEVAEFYKSESEEEDPAEDAAWQPSMEPERTASDVDSADEEHDGVKDNKTNLPVVNDNESDGNESALENDLQTTISKDDKINGNDSAIDADVPQDYMNNDMNAEMSKMVSENEAECPIKDFGTGEESTVVNFEEGKNVEEKDAGDDNSVSFLCDNDNFAFDNIVAKTVSEAHEASQEENSMSSESLHLHIETQSQSTTVCAPENLSNPIVERTVKTSNSKLNNEGSSAELGEDDLPDLDDLQSCIKYADENKPSKNTHHEPMEEEEDRNGLVLLDDSNGLVLLDDDETEESFRLTDLSKIAPEEQSTDPANTDSINASLAGLPSKLSKLASKLGVVPMMSCVNSVPRLSLDPSSGGNGIIDLDEDFSSPRHKDPGLVALMDRFARHSATKMHKKHSEQVNMSVVSKEKDGDGKDQLVSSEVVVNLEGDREEQFSQCTTPGGKLTLLKTSLRQKILEQRTATTRLRQQQKNFMETEEVEAVEDPFALPDEEEIVSDADMTESEPEEEDDVDMSDKPRHKSNFVQEEAEEEEDNDPESPVAAPEEHDEDTNDWLQLEGDDDENSNNSARSGGKDAVMESGNVQDQESDEEEIIGRKVKSSKSKHRQPKKKTNLVLDSDDEDTDLPSTSAPGTDYQSGDEDGFNTDRKSTEESDKNEQTGKDSQLESMRSLGGLETVGEKCDLGNNTVVDGDTNKPLESDTPGIDAHCSDDDIPATNPVDNNQLNTSTSFTSLPKGESSAVNLSLDDSFSVELQGSCIAGHQPARRRKMDDAETSHSHLLGLDSMSQEPLWVSSDHPMNTSSNSFMGRQTGLSSCGLDVCGPPASSNSLLPSSQELRLDFRGVTDSQDNNGLMQLPALCSGTFSNAGRALTTDNRAVGGSTQSDMANLMGLCSGQFTGATKKPAPISPPSLTLANPPQSVRDSAQSALDETVLLTKPDQETQIGVPVNNVTSSKLADDELLDLCSGDFTSQFPQPKTKDSSRASKGQAKLTSFFSRGSKFSKDVVTQSSAKTAEKTISFVSSIIVKSTESTGNKDALDKLNENKTAEQSDSESSSDEEAEPAVDAVDAANDQSNKRRRIITMDDDDSDDGEAKEDQSQKEDAVEASDSDEEEDNQPEMRVYDEDENEITNDKFLGFKDRKRGGIRTDFLENEAELSGSERGSDDEEDGELDDFMEEEAGDEEHFDEDQLREQVGLTHFRGELAKDQREVRLLQELYLEDGDLHGEGRQRTFRWKNLDKDDDDETGPNNNDSDNDNSENEDEETAKWRQQRVEREQFLREKKEKGEAISVPEDDIDGSVLFKTSSIPIVNKTRMLFRSSSVKKPAENSDVCTSNDSATPKNPLQIANPEQEPRSVVMNPPLLKQTSLPSTLNKCGSFLSRGASKLARLAAIIKERNDGSQSVAAKANASGNFVFQSLTAEEARQAQGSSSDGGRKRAASGVTAAASAAKKQKTNAAASSQKNSIFKRF